MTIFFEMVKKNGDDTTQVWLGYHLEDEATKEQKELFAKYLKKFKELYYRLKSLSSLPYKFAVWDDNKVVINNYKLPKNDYGYGYGPITSYYSHSCSQQSYFTFSNIVMETITGYYLKVDKVADKWGLTNDYWNQTFTLTNVEYVPAEGEVITNFSDYPLFKNADDMVLFYPDGTYEHIPWKNGKADYDNSERYINVLESNVDAGTVKLKPGEQIIGAYAE